MVLLAPSWHEGKNLQQDEQIKMNIRTSFGSSIVTLQNWFAGVRPVRPGDSEQAAYFTAAGQRAITVGDGLANAAEAADAQRTAGVLRCKKIYCFTRISRKTLLIFYESSQGDARQ
jgi:hypothetical protein